MNKKIVIVLGLSIVILGIFFSISASVEKQNEIITIENPKILQEIEPEKSEQEVLKEIEEKYNEIDNNKELVSDFIIKERVWQSSGPFSIDRKEYALGERIFMKVESLKTSDKGEVIFMKILNQTHQKIWTKHSFDGNLKESYNVYFEPKLTTKKLICDKEDLLGEWKLIFTGTNYENLNFIIYDAIVPGDEDDFQPVC